ncbi:MAG: YihA family ribosome biogenesis GTP-binding protein [Flavobacteriales bacterium]|nr:YihA family ribosome biogenesis GTP-binding protein [Flavobacteriales bacterium]
MEIKSAQFLISNSEASKCPDTEMFEYAFIGRSNVGKSSLINALTNRNKLAKTSGTPGKTLLINHFIINKEWHLVDLPGYGYAKRSKDDRAGLEKLIQQYVLTRKQLISMFVLIDARHTPQQIDLEFMEWLGKKGIPFVIVFTKMDKLKKNQQVSNIAAYKEEMLKTWGELPHSIATSATKKTGCKELLDYIEKTNLEVSK